METQFAPSRPLLSGKALNCVEHFSAFVFALSDPIRLGQMETELVQSHPLRFGKVETQFVLSHPLLFGKELNCVEHFSAFVFALSDLLRLGKVETELVQSHPLRFGKALNCV